MTKLVFVWENLGPTHVDRLGSLAEALGADAEVVGLQLFERSKSYGWTPGGSGGGDAFATVCLLRADEPRTSRRLVPKLMKACLRQGKATFFLCHYNAWPVFATALMLRLLGRRVYTMIDSKFDDQPRRLWRELLKSVFLLPYRGVLTASHRSGEYMRFFGFPADRIALGYDTLSIDRIRAQTSTPPAPDGIPFAERDFVCVARLVPKKNIETTLRAYALWLGRAAHPRDLHLCGSGPLEAELRAQAEALGISGRVHFHGFVQSDEVSRIMARGLLLLLNSTEEQFGLVVVEAQALGLPVIVTRNAGAADVHVRDGLNGFTVNPADPESCAALMALLSEDEARWRAFATAARHDSAAGDCRHFVEGALRLARS